LTKSYQDLARALSSGKNKINIQVDSPCIPCIACRKLEKKNETKKTLTWINNFK
jgi:hypothetical protein